MGDRWAVALSLTPLGRVAVEHVPGAERSLCAGLAATLDDDEVAAVVAAWRKRVGDGSAGARRRRG